MVNLQLSEEQLEALSDKLESCSFTDDHHLPLHQILLKIRMMKYSQAPLLGYLKMPKISEDRPEDFRKNWETAMSGSISRTRIAYDPIKGMAK